MEVNINTVDEFDDNLNENFSKSIYLDNKIIENGNKEIVPCKNCISNYIQCITCKGFFKYDFYFMRHEELCKKLFEEYKDKDSLQRCPNCSCLVVKQHLETHSKNCKEAYVTLLCQFCSKSFSKELIETHEKLCLEIQIKKQEIQATVECTYCKLPIIMANIQAHEEECLKLKKEKSKIDKELGKGNGQFKYPDDWTFDSQFLEASNIWVIPLAENSLEFKKAEELFYKGIDLFKLPIDIIQIRKIQNKKVYDNFCNEQDKITKEKGYCETRTLFFGDRTYAERSILIDGLEISNIKGDLMFGKGIHLDNSARESVMKVAKFTKKGKIYICTTIIGVPFVSKDPMPYICLPPLLDQYKCVYYDSVTDKNYEVYDCEREQTFAVYSGSKVLPIYEISFSFVN